jgi:hypothetical protein
MPPNSNARQYDSIRSYPYVVTYHDRFGADALFVNPSVRISKVVIQCRHRDALRQVYVMANAYGTNHCTVDANARIVTNGHVSHSIINTAI